MWKTFNVYRLGNVIEFRSQYCFPLLQREKEKWKIKIKSMEILRYFNFSAIDLLLITSIFHVTQH